MRREPGPARRSRRVPGGGCERLVICFGLLITQVVLERFQPPLDCGDRLLMHFLIKRVDGLASGLEAFGRAYDAVDDPGDGASDHACREMNRKTSATPKMSSDRRRRSSATSSVSMVIPWGVSENSNADDV